MSMIYITVVTLLSFAGLLGAAFVVVGSLLLFSVAVSWALGLFYGALALLIALVRREHRKG